MHVAKFIKETRKSLKMNQAQFGDLVQKNRFAITNYETGRAMPPGDVILKIISIRFPDLRLSDAHSKPNNDQNATTNEPFCRQQGRGDAAA